MIYLSWNLACLLDENLFIKEHVILWALVISLSLCLLEENDCGIVRWFDLTILPYFPLVSTLISVVSWLLTWEL